ncbi:MAG: ATP-binding cassette domain-containing protein [Leptolyngbya sp. PLA1]|nr:ATP-binding cassette domain-containing protein [Leptolyngbya sp. PLA1]
MTSGVDTARNPSRPAALAASPIIRLEALEKRFGSQVVLDGVTLSFEEAKTTVIMGPSGCGKSVMLKHIIGLLRPDAGAVYYDGLRVDRLSERRWGPIRQDIGLLFQMSALFDSMTVAENVEFPLREHTSLTAAQRDRRIAEALEVVDMLGFEQRLPAQLSGGQRKRVALARAIVLRPRVVLYDEPTTGLDPIRAAGIDGLILKLRRTLGVTNIVVTHDLTSAERVADTAVMLLQGRVAAQGSFATLRACTDPRVQHFLRGVYDRDEDRGSDESPQDPDSPDRP